MPDYAKMYRELFQATTIAIEILQQAQIRTEELYISAEAEVLSLLTPNGEDSNEVS